LFTAGLQDRAYYHFISDGIQHLCDEAGIFPCVLYAAIFSSYDSGGWKISGGNAMSQIPNSFSNNGVGLIKRKTAGN